MPVNQSSKFAAQPRLLSYLAGVIAPALLALAGPATAQSPVGVGGAAFTTKTAITLPGGQKISSFDISFVDPVISTYVLADRTNKSIDVINTQTNTLVKQLFANFAGFTGNNDTSGPDGVMIIDHVQVWAGDAGSLLKIIDLNSGALLNTINTGGVNRVDEMCFDPVHRIAMMANNADDPPFVTFVSANPGNAILKRLNFDGSNGTPHATNGIEQCQWSPQTGKFIIAVPEINGPGNNTQPGGVTVIDPVSLTVDTTFIVSTPSCRGPQGTAIGPNFELALNCNATGTSVIIDVRNGNLIAALPNQTGGGDMVWYNPGDNRYFFANAGNGFTPPATTQVLAVVNEGNIFNNFNANTAEIVITRTSAGGNVHSVAADPVLNQVYVPISSGANAGLCTQGGGNEAQGCIVVLTNPDDTMCNVGGSPVISVQNDNSPSFFRTLCLLHAVP
jgi:hypothetical protein